MTTHEAEMHSQAEAAKDMEESIANQDVELTGLLQELDTRESRYRELIERM